MAQRQSELPENIQARQLGGLDQRSSPANLELGSFSWLEGLYQAQSGLLERIPGKTLLVTATGAIRQIHPTYNQTQDVIVQTLTGRYVYTVNELRNRVVSPSLVFPPINEEETMSYAILVQQEANTASGGAIDGTLSGSSSASPNTFVGRRLTAKLVDDAGFVTFTASTGGSGTTSTPGTFALGSGTYRVTIDAAFGMNNGASAVIGLYNNTDSQFQPYSGTTTPIVGMTTVAGSGVDNCNCHLEGEITVPSSGTLPRVFQIMQQCTDTATCRTLSCCGLKYSSTSTNVNGAAILQNFCIVKILKSA